VNSSQYFFGIFFVWKRNWILFLKTWTVSVWWIVFEPTVMLLTLGFGVGSFISNINGLSYMEFVFPSMLCTTAMFVSFFESTYNNFAKLTIQKTYSTLMLAPLVPAQIAVAEILWGTTKGTISALGVAIVATAFGMVQSTNIIWVLLVAGIIAFMFATFGLIITTMVKSFDEIIYPSSGIIIPLSFLSSTYFPIDSIPGYFKFLAYLSPLTHAVELCRGLLHGSLGFGLGWVHFSILLVFSAVLFRFAIKRFSLMLAP
jgi:lipooligosaccharide transport system permease protein